MEKKRKFFVVFCSVRLFKKIRERARNTQIFFIAIYLQEKLKSFVDAGFFIYFYSVK